MAVYGRLPEDPMKRVQPRTGPPVPNMGGIVRQPVVSPRPPVPPPVVRAGPPGPAPAPGFAATTTPAPALAPPPSLAEELVTATGAGGAGFRRPETVGATPFRSVEFYRGRRPAPDVKQGLSVGAPSALGSAGERDDEARILRAARLSRM